MGMSLSLFLRKRRVLLIIFGCSLTYFIVATYGQLNRRTIEEEEIVSSVKLEEILKTVKPIGDDFVDQFIEKSKGKGVSTLINSDKKLDTDSEKPADRNSNSSSSYNCRNSVQGRAFIADENGYLCDRFDLQVNGCCNVDAPSTKRYKCDNCTPSGCCSFYEQCVSCCLHPQKVG